MDGNDGVAVGNQRVARAGVDVVGHLLRPNKLAVDVSHPDASRDDRLAVDPFDRPAVLGVIAENVPIKNGVDVWLFQIWTVNFRRIEASVVNEDDGAGISVPHVPAEPFSI